MKKAPLSKLERAEKKVKEIKDFYNHLGWFLVVNIVVLIVRFRLFDIFPIESVSVGKNIAIWIDVNMTVMPLLWLFGLICHGLYVYKNKFRFFKNWEQRQIEKYMEEDEQTKYL